jgi:hypothetical protein
MVLCVSTVSLVSTVCSPFRSPVVSLDLSEDGRLCFVLAGPSEKRADDADGTDDAVVTLRDQSDLSSRTPVERLFAAPREVRE